MKAALLYPNPKNPYPFEGSQDQWEHFKYNQVLADHEFFEANKIAYDSKKKKGKKMMIIAGNKRHKAVMELIAEGKWPFGDEIPSNYLIDVAKWPAKKRNDYIVASNVSIGKWSMKYLAPDVAEKYSIRYVAPPSEEELANFFEQGKSKGSASSGLKMMVLKFKPRQFSKVEKYLLQHGDSLEQALINLSK